MKYNQPYGISDPNAPYINGDPSIGRAGSIPPAASIEYPQREIVNLIADAGLLPPDNADLHQLARSVQSQLLNSKDDAGTQNQYQVTLSPAPLAYFKYLTVVAHIVNTNTGASTLNVNALGPKPIVRTDGTPVIAGDIAAGAIVCFVYDGTKFQMVWVSGGTAAGPIYLTAPRTYYVNWNTGSDTLYDGTTAAVVADTIHGPFKTPQRASDEINKYNLNGFVVTVIVADYASYPGFVAPHPGGGGYVDWQGNWAILGNVGIAGVNRTAIAVVGAENIFRGFKLTTSGASAGDNLCLINISGPTSEVRLRDVEYGASAGPHIHCSSGGNVSFFGLQRISGNSTTNPLSGAAWLTCFLNAAAAVNGLDLPSLVITVPVNLGTFIVANQLGVSVVRFSSITNPGNVTGKKYDASMNGVINSEGGGINYYPGTIAGTTGSGGQYV